MSNLRTLPKEIWTNALVNEQSGLVPVAVESGVSDGCSLFVHSLRNRSLENVRRAWLCVRRQVLSTQRVGVWRGDGVDCAWSSYRTSDGIW